MLAASFGPRLISYSSHTSALHSSVSLCSFIPILFFFLSSFFYIYILGKIENSSRLFRI